MDTDTKEEFKVAADDIIRTVKKLVAVCSRTKRENL